MKPTKLLLSCSHAVNIVPAEYQHLFAADPGILNTHQAFDLFALEITQRLSVDLNCPFIQSYVTRLLVNCNHNGHPSHCYSDFTKNLPKPEKERLLHHYYFPFQHRTQELIRQYIDSGQQVLHLSIHTFTPELRGEVRNAGIGLLYDPHRHAEKEVIRLWNSLLLHQMAYRIRMNYPHSYVSEGFINSIRKQYSEKDYLGLELQVNQALLKNPDAFDEIVRSLSDSLQELMQLL